MLGAHVAPFGHPVGVDPARFHLLVPYDTDPATWLTRRWIDKYSGATYAVTTSAAASADLARLARYEEVLRDFAVHPEPKLADARGRPCSRGTVGLLQRRRVRIGTITYQGKESNPTR